MPMTKTLVFWLLIATTANTVANELSAPARVTTLTPWPAITQLINYQNKLWFVHSDPYQDTNAANIYSFDPQTGLTQFERSLFSQDAGKPVIHNNLLFWPFEDPRRSAGSGEYAITNGIDWQWRIMQTGNAMHVHALTTCNNQVIAVTGSWTGQALALQGNNTWTLQQEYPSGKASFSRLVDALEYKGDCYVAASSNNDPQVKMLRSTDHEFLPVDGWPVSDRVDGLTLHKNKLYAWADIKKDRTLHAYDGTNVQAIPIDKGHRIRDLYSNGNALYVISSKGSSGTLWSLNEKNQLVPVSELPFIPLSLTADSAGHLYIGSFDRSGAALWKIVNRSPLNESTPLLVSDLKIDTTADISEVDFSEQFEILRSLITDPSNGANNGSALRSALGRPEHLTHPKFANVLTRLLEVPLPDTTVSMFNGREVVWTDLVHWYLLTSMAINGHGTVDTTLLNQPWTKNENRSSKYFDPTIAAIVTSGWIKQSDQKTINTLIKRLTTPGNDPVWLQTDVAGALTAITGQRFGLDGAAWVRWARTHSAQ